MAGVYLVCMQPQAGFILLSCCAEGPPSDGQPPMSDESDNPPDLTQPISSEDDGEELADEDYGGPDACPATLACCWVGGLNAQAAVACRPSEEASELYAWCTCSL